MSIIKTQKKRKIDEIERATTIIMEAEISKDDFCEFKKTQNSLYERKI